MQVLVTLLAGQSLALIIADAIVISRIDYCNSVLSGLPTSTLQPLTSVLNAAARLIKGIGPRDHITQSLQQLHWLPIRAHIAFKISLLMYHIQSGTSPSYMTSMVVPCSASNPRGIRSAARGDYHSSHQEEVWKSFFCCLGT